MKVLGRILAISLSLILLDSSIAQEKPSSGEPMNAQLAKPGEEHQRFAVLQGEWQLAVKFGGSKYSGEAINKTVLDGRFLVCECEAKSGNEKLASIFTLGFDRRHQEFTVILMDSFGTYSVSAKGKVKGGAKTIKMYGSDDDPYLESIGIKKEFAIEVDLSNDEKMAITIFMIDTRTEKRQEHKLMEYQFSKTK